MIFTGAYDTYYDYPHEYSGIPELTIWDSGYGSLYYTQPWAKYDMLTGTITDGDPMILTLDNQIQDYQRELDKYHVMRVKYELEGEWDVEYLYAGGGYYYESGDELLLGEINYAGQTTQLIWSASSGWTILNGPPF